MLLGVIELQKDSGTMVECGFFKAEQLKLAKKAVKFIYTFLRPQMIPLIEALGVQDVEVPSVIGNKYGDIYEAQLEMAKSSRVNSSKLVQDGLDAFLLPVLHGKL